MRLFADELLSAQGRSAAWGRWRGHLAPRLRPGHRGCAGLGQRRTPCGASEPV